MAGHLVTTAKFQHDNYVNKLPGRGFLQDIDINTGAAGRNRAWHKVPAEGQNIRQQEIGELHICQGIAKDNPRKIRRGLKVLSYGMDLQRADGSFPGGRAEESWVGTAFFLAAAASSLTMLAAAKAPQAEEFKERWCPQLARAAQWLGERPSPHLEAANHLCAAAGGAAMLGAMWPADEVVTAAGGLCREACELQTAEGYWPERAGFDTHYQAISLIYLSYALVSTTEAELRNMLWAALERGFGWLAEKISEDGAVDCSQNTRKRWERAADREAIRPGDFVPLTFALRMWAEITQEKEWDALAQRVEGWARTKESGGAKTTGGRMTKGGD